MLGGQPSARSRGINNLPYDIWPLILVHLSHIARRLPRDLVSLSSTCRDIRSAVEPALWSHVTLSGPLGSGPRWSDFLRYQLQRFENEPWLGQHVRSCHIVGWHTPKDDWTGLKPYSDPQDLLELEFLNAIARTVMLFQNIYRINLRSLLVSDTLFQHLRMSAVTRIDMLFCDVQSVSVRGHSVGDAFKNLTEFHFNDIWWSRDFSMNDIICAPRLTHADIGHSHDFPSPFDVCSAVSLATNLRFLIHNPAGHDSLCDFLKLFPCVTTLYVRGEVPLPLSCPVSSIALLPKLRQLDGPFSTTSAVFAVGRPVESVNLHHPLLDIPRPTVDDARAIAAGLLLSTTPIVEIHMCALTVSNYAAVLPEFRSNFRLVHKLHIVAEDDGTGSAILEWIAGNLRDHLPRLKELIIGNEHLLPNSGYFRRTTPALPNTMDCLNHVASIARSCPRLRTVLLPGRRYVYGSQGHWDREMVPLDE